MGPTTNCPADPPAIPDICVAPTRVAALEAGKFLVAIVDCPNQGKDAARSLKHSAHARNVASAGSETTAPPKPTTAAAIGRTFRGPSWSIATPATRLNGEYP